MDRPRFIVDEDLPRSLHRALREAGFDAVDVRDIGLRGQPDDRVLAEAIRQDRTLLTGDMGFGNLIRFPLGSHHGIAVARFSTQMPTAEVTRLIVAAVATLTTADLRGALVVIEPDRVRLRLPDDSDLAHTEL